MGRDPELGPHRDASVSHGADRVGKVGGGIQLQHVCAAFLHQVPSRPHRGVVAFLQRPKGDVAAHQGSLHAPPNSLACEDHLLECHIQLTCLSPHVDPDGVANRNDVHSCAVDDLRHLVVIDDDPDDLPTITLHLLKRRDSHLALHTSSSNRTRLSG